MGRGGTSPSLVAE